MAIANSAVRADTTGLGWFTNTEKYFDLAFGEIRLTQKFMSFG